MSGPLIRPLDTPADFAACVALQRETWGDDFGELVPPTVLRTVQRVGGVAAGAFGDDGRLLGFVFGFSGIEPGGRKAHWSDMLAVRPEWRGRGLGVALKLWQRRALLPLGVEVVYWTFEPLESRNAYINFARLGIVAREYHRDYYGETASPLHRGLGTDRLVALWEIAGERVRRRLEGEERPPGEGDVASLPLVNPPAASVGGFPACAPPDLAIDADRLRIAVPADVQRLKAADPGLARDWRAKTRAAFEACFARGYAALELARGGETSWYVLGRSEPTSSP